MDRLFRRNEDYVKVLISEAEIYTKKHERTEFEDYICTFIGEEYRKAAQPYFKKAKSGGYLETLIDLCNQIENMNVNQEDAYNRRSLLLQALMVAIYKPKLLFGKQCNSGRIGAKSVRKFEKTIQKLYRGWDKFQAEMDLCQHYIDRGTTRLNRPAESDRLAKVRPQLANEINGIYKAYHYQLSSLDIPISKDEPCINEDGNLFLNATERPWLLPLAHIILIRDAQFQMMGRGKYKDEVLLLGDQGTFPTEKISQEQQKECDLLTSVYAMRIRDILARYLVGNQKSDCRTAFNQYFKREYDSKRKELETAETNLRLFRLVPPYAAYMKIRADFLDKIDTFHTPDFSVPSCRISETALKIGKKLKLPPDIVQKLERVIPDALWSQSALEKALDGFDAKTKEQLIPLLTPLRTLLNAKEYYSESKSDSVISDNLIKAAVTVYSNYSDNPPQQKDKDKMFLAWKAYREMITFHDLTRSALVLSHAVGSKTALDDVRFGPCCDCEAELHQNLKEYRTSAYLKTALGIKGMNRGKLSEVRYDQRFDQLREKLSKSVAGVGFNGELSFKAASGYLLKIRKIKQCVERQEYQQWELDFQKLKGLAKKEKIPIPTESWQQEALCFDVYRRLARKAVSVVEEHITGLLFMTMLEDYRYRKENP